MSFENLKSVDIESLNKTDLQSYINNLTLTDCSNDNQKAVLRDQMLVVANKRLQERS